MNKNLICIVCPRGCHLTIDENMNVSGNFCKRGEVYAKNEVTHPTRMITSTVKVYGGELERLPVATSAPIPKEDIFKVMVEINKASINAPVNIKDVVIKNVLGLDVDIVATRNIKKL